MPGWRLIVGMRRKRATADQIIAEIAARQHGVVALDQLYRAGLTHPAVRRRSQAGRLHRVHRGVYAIGNPNLTREGHWMAAVLACGQGAVLSHQSAAALWKLSPTSPAVVHVTTDLGYGPEPHPSQARPVRGRFPLAHGAPRRRGRRLEVPRRSRFLRGRSGAGSRAPPPRIHRPSLHRPGADQPTGRRGRLPASPPLRSLEPPGPPIAVSARGPGMSAAPPRSIARARGEIHAALAAGG
jgi:hypothetical protein